MANALYTKAKEAFLAGNIDLSSDTIKIALVDTALYTPNITTDQYYTAISPAVVGATQTFTSKTITNGVFDADNVTFTTVSGDTVEALVIYKDTGVSGTSPLIAYIDTALGLTVTPNGGDITITWDDGAYKIFSLS